MSAIKKLMRTAEPADQLTTVADHTECPDTHELISRNTLSPFDKIYRPEILIFAVLQVSNLSSLTISLNWSVFVQYKSGPIIKSLSGMVEHISSYTPVGPFHFEVSCLLH
jgi:hypothetical protein